MAKTALGLVMAHHPEIRLQLVTEAMPTNYRDATEIDLREVLVSVSGYATRVASMVNTLVYYKEHDLPTTSKDTSSKSEGEYDSGVDVESEEICLEKETPMVLLRVGMMHRVG